MPPSRRQILAALAFGAAVHPGCVSIDTGGPRPVRASCVPAESPYWTARPSFPVGTPSPTPGVPVISTPITNPLPEALPPVITTSGAAR